MRYALSMTMALCLAAFPAVAWASIQQSPIEGDIPTCVADRGMGAFDIPTHESMMTALHFPGAIKQEVRSCFGHRSFKVEHKKDTLLVAPRPDRRPAEPAKGIMARLSPGQRGLAGLVIERAKDISGPMTIVLEQAGGARSARAILQNWVPMQTHHTVRHLELRPVKPPDPEKGKVSVHLQGVYGAIWLGDGTGADLSDATSMTGLGVRAQYAFNRSLHSRVS